MSIKNKTVVVWLFFISLVFSGGFLFGIAVWAYKGKGAELDTGYLFWSFLSVIIASMLGLRVYFFDAYEKQEKEGYK